MVQGVGPSDGESSSPLFLLVSSLPPFRRVADALPSPPPFLSFPIYHFLPPPARRSAPQLTPHMACNLVDIIPAFECEQVLNLSSFIRDGVPKNAVNATFGQ